MTTPTPPDFGGSKGWVLVEEKMESLIGKRMATAEGFMRHFESHDYLRSYNRFQGWVINHPGLSSMDCPRHIRSIKTSRQIDRELNESPVNEEIDS